MEVENFASSMVIPGYDSGDVAEVALEHAGARVAVVAAVVPDEFGLEKSVREPPSDALAEPVDLVGHDDMKAVEAFRISLVYDPSKLPPGASPTDVAVAVETSGASEMQRADGNSAERSSADRSSGRRPLEEAVDGGWEPLDSSVDLEETTVSAVLNSRPQGSTVVAAYDDRDDGSAEPGA